MRNHSFMKKLFAIFLFSFLNLFIYGQNWGNGGGGGNWKEMSDRMKVGQFYGKIVDTTTSKAVEYASVQLIGSVFDTVSKSMKSGVIVAGQLTQENGEFRLEKINVMGKFTLKISALGYKVKEIPVSFNFDMEKVKSGNFQGAMGAMYKDLGNIKISADVKQLKAVDIVSSAPVFELKLDKKVFNVDKDMSASGGTAEDILKKVPSVSVDMDGNVTLRNSSPEIFVDGKPTTLTIDQIPADAIQSIEVITNPSAKYDASGGQAGILNIVLKKDKRMGYNGNIRFGSDQYARMNGGGDINVRSGKINAFVSGNVNQRYSVSEGITTRNNLIGIPLTSISQSQTNINEGMFMHSRGGIDWFMNNRNTFTFSGNYVQGRFEPVDELNTVTDTVYPAGSSSYFRVSETGRKFHNKGGSIQYKHLFPKEEHELTGDVNYNKSQFIGWGDYSSQYKNSAGNNMGNPILQDMKSEGYTEILSAQTDYVRPINGKGKFETGVRGTNRNFLSKLENFLMNDSTGEFEQIKNQTSHYRFNDKIIAAYAIYGKQYEKINWQFGLRAESSFYTGELVDSNKTFKNYFPASFFPSLSSTYAINEKDNVQLSYSRRINRPTFFQLIPFTDYSDSLNLRRGNAGLAPEFTHSVELSYLKVLNAHNNILISGYFKNTTDIIASYQVNEYDTVLDRNAIITTYQNANSSSVYGGELTSKHTVKKWLELTLNGNAYYSILNARNIEANLTNERFSWNAKGNFNVKLPKNFSVQLSAEYKSKTAVPVSGGGSNKFGGPTGGMGGQGWMGSNAATAQGYTKAKWEAGASVRYEFMKNKAASLTVNIRDIFGTDVQETYTESIYFTQTTSRIRDPRLVRVNFSYRFGKFDASLFKRKNTKVNMDGMDMGM